MKVVAFIEPPQGDVIEKILRHCGLWNLASPRAPPPGHGVGPRPGPRFGPGSDELRELTFVDEATFWATLIFPDTNRLEDGPRSLRHPGLICPPLSRQVAPSSYKKPPQAAKGAGGLW